jgi:hypothetical protein
MDRRSFVRGVATVAALTSFPVAAQETKRLPRIALVFGSIPAVEMAGAEPIHPYARAFVHAMRISDWSMAAISCLCDVRPRAVPIVCLR